MTVQEAVGLFSSRADGEVIVANACKKARSWVFAHAHDLLSAAQQRLVRQAAAQRKKHVPVAYITGTQEFYGREFVVDKHVLVPRPATEELVRIFLEWRKNPTAICKPIDSGIVAFGWGRAAIEEGVGERTRERGVTIIDMGTGSGCIAITLALECPDDRMLAVDCSTAALRVAQRNSALHGVDNRVDCLRASAVPPMPVPYLIISNPPYIPDGTRLHPDVLSEPTVALFAGSTGLDVLEPLFARALHDPLCMGILTECRRDQTPALRKLIAKVKK